MTIAFARGVMWPKTKIVTIGVPRCARSTCCVACTAGTRTARCTAPATWRKRRRKKQEAAAVEVAAVEVAAVEVADVVAEAESADEAGAVEEIEHTT